MDFYQTYYAVREISNIQDNVDNINKNINYIRNKVVNKIIEILWVIAIIAIICLAIWFICDAYHSIHSTYKFFDKVKEIITYIIIGFISLLILPVILLVLHLVIDYIIDSLLTLIIKPSKAKVEQINKLINNREELYHRINVLKNSLENSIVPKHYRNLDAMQFMVTAFEHKRANTLTDLINLYEIHVESTNRNNKINELIKEKQNLTNQVSQLNDSNKKLTDEVKRVRRKI